MFLTRKGHQFHMFGGHSHHRGQMILPCHFSRTQSKKPECIKEVTEQQRFHIFIFLYSRHHCSNTTLMYILQYFYSAFQLNKIQNMVECQMIYCLRTPRELIVCKVSKEY